MTVTYIFIFIVFSNSQTEILSMMDSAAGFMNDTLNDVLNISKIEGERAECLRYFKFVSQAPFILSLPCSLPQSLPLFSLTLNLFLFVSFSLSLSLLSDGNLKLAMKPFKLRFLIDSSLKSVASRAEEKRIKIVFQGGKI